MSLNNVQNISNPTFWNNLYETNNDKWNIGMPTPAFIDWEKQNHITKSIKVCIPGCGKGDDALYFSRCGHDVYAFDFSKYAIKHLDNKSEKLKIKVNSANLDFFKMNSKYINYFDLIVEYTFFCAFDPSRRHEYVSICKDMLKKNGRFLGLFFPLNEVDDPNPPFKITIDEVTNLFSESFILIDKYYPKNSIKGRKNNEILMEFIRK